MNRKTPLHLLRYPLCVLGGIAVLVSSVATSPQTAGGGKAPTKRNGVARSVWDGVYTEAQAKRGHGAYTRHCESCHQSDLRGFDCNPPLVGEAFTRRWNGQSVADLFQKVQATMPAGAAGSLSAQQYADVIGYVLSANEFPVGRVELSPDPAKLKPIAVEGKAGQ